jgi:hypothetical protein
MQAWFEASAGERWSGFHKLVLDGHFLECTFAWLGQSKFLSFVAMPCILQNVEEIMVDVRDMLMGTFSCNGKTPISRYMYLLAFSGALAEETSVSGASPLMACL